MLSDGVPPTPRPAMRFPITILTLAIALSPVMAQQPDRKTDFAHDVVPILKAKCAKCHTNGTYKNGLSFDTRAELLKGKAAVPGKSAASEIIKRVTSTDPEMRMPPEGASAFGEGDRGAGEVDR